jgi:hypothetical protein
MCTSREQCRSNLCLAGFCLQVGTLFTEQECGWQ